MTTSRRWLRLALAVTALCSTVLGLVVAEVGLRVAGYTPARGRSQLTNEPSLNEPDPVLGWRVKTGKYRFPGYTPNAAPITMTYWPNGSRATGPSYVAQDRRVVLIGDSFTQGWAISDDETYAWKLQQRFPEVEFLNYGTAGYNGLQALLRLEEHLDARPKPPAVVIYGFNNDQELRNVADGSWLQALALNTSRQTVALPFCSLDATGDLQRHPPEGYPMWPLRDRLATVALLERSWFRSAVGNRRVHGRAVTEKLLTEMNRVVRARGSRFLVAILGAMPELRVHYSRYLMTHGIPFVDCTYRERFLIVPGEGHPNGAANTKWADCVARVLGVDLAAANAGAPALAGGAHGDGRAGGVTPP